MNLTIKFKRIYFLSLSKSNQTQGPSQAPSSQKQPSSIHDSQDTVQNGASNIVQQLDPNDGKGGIKTLKITQVTLLSSGISPSNIVNGNNPSGTDIKMNEKSSIWCMDRIINYLSLGCTSTSKRKKKSLLNIYKLIQADSVPFINLFFLVIFFVYKRKFKYLEL
ncbi:PIR protein CIR protein [Plasmodium vinckei petteri]|uniref:PIR protein CIR protein n=1 Tax=Plasmodium vinckei petteri TaxID=138298 RepID=A0A6V7SGH1_PLAVN|nr:PIR protein CIR protein [Plasmodium vinckei petteri]